MAEARYKKEFRRTARVKKALDHSLNFYFTRMTPIFDAEMGRRLANARKVMKLSQTELGEILGMSQSDIHRLEHGKIAYIPLSTQQFKDALTEHFDYIFRGSFSLRYNYEKTKENS